MQYYDQHAHTYFSPDSKELFENYLALTDKPFVSTEHLDFFHPRQMKKNVIPDFVGYSRVVDQLNILYPNPILKGIEVGYTHRDRHEIKAFLKDKDYDVVLMSIHHNGWHNFMHLGNDDVPVAENLEEYYSLMMQAVEHFPEANVLAHFDYGLRSYDVNVAELQQVENKLIRIFNQIIENGTAFELNTRSMYAYGNAHLYDYAIGLYRSLGGELFTVSSDAHTADDYELRFQDAFNMLQRHGVTQLATFQQRELTLVDLPVKVFV